MSRTATRQGPAPAIHVAVALSDWGVFGKVSPEELREGDLIAFSTHDVGRVESLVDIVNRGTTTVTYRTARGDVLTRSKRTRTATIALVERDGQRREAPAGTRFDR